MNKGYNFKQCFDDNPTYLEMLNFTAVAAKEDAE